MSCSKVMQAILGLSIIVALTGCAGYGAGNGTGYGNGEPLGAASGPPDLVPIPEIASFDPVIARFCQLDSESNLVVIVRNQGGSLAGPSITRVSFGDTFFDHNIPSLAPQSPGVEFSQSLLFGQSSDSIFTIEVDFGKDVDEANEDNNIGHGLCLG